jgi:hypothetical protein
VQTSLFSTTVAIFLTESYKLLPRDLNNAIMASLSQMAHQLVSISNVAPFQNVIFQNNAPFKPPASAIRINVTWLLSLVLGLTHALSVAYPLSGFAQYHGARHNYPPTLHGIERSRPPRVVDPMPTLLHLSIFLFIAGLIDFLLLTNKIVAFCVLGYLSAFSFACLVFTAFSSHPRRTSLPEFAWRISLVIILAVLVSVVEIGGLLCVFLSSIWNQAPLRVPEHPFALATWRDALEGQIRRRRRSPANGLWWSINLNSTAVQPSIDTSPICQTPSAPDQDQKIKDFVARKPGVFGSGAVPCATSPVLPSMEVRSDLSTSDPILGSCFHDFPNTCIPGASALTEESRTNGLRASLKSLWYCGRAYHRLGNSAPLPHYIRDVFAGPETTSRIQNEPDPAARVMGRCFASLIAKKLSSDANARSGPNVRFSDAELASLSAILGSGEMMDRLDQPGVFLLANIISLLSGEIDTLLDGKVPLPSDVEQIIQETVVIILGTEALRGGRHAGAELPLALVAQFRGVVSEVANAPAPEWLRVQLKEISEGLPTIPFEERR